MTSTDIGLLVLGILALAAAGLAAFVARMFHHDEIFEGVTPGVIPPQPESAPRTRVKGDPEYVGEIAVAFAPPQGLRPGLVGTVVDGSVDSRDLTATFVDLAVRGHLKITAVPADKAPSADRVRFARRPETEPRKVDWVLERSADLAYDSLDSTESRLLDAVFHAGPAARMSQLDRVALQAMRETQVEFYREVVRRRWYPRHPQQKGAGVGCAVIGVGVVLAVLFVLVRHTPAGIVSALLVLGASLLLTRYLRGRTPRTAEGTAVRIQALGFKKYLATAEADQFKFEEAAGIFGRYLPYAMVFGVAQHWSKVFGEVAKSAEQAGEAGKVDFDLTWFDLRAWDVVDMATDLMWIDSLDGTFDLLDGDALGAAAGFGGDIVEGLGGFATEVGDFMGSLDFLDGIGDGCDLGGCLDF